MGKLYTILCWKRCFRTVCYDLFKTKREKKKLYRIRIGMEKKTKKIENNKIINKYSHITATRK